MLNRCLRLLCHNRPIWVWRCSLVTERCSQTPPSPPSYDFNWTVVHWYGSNEHWYNNMGRRLLKDVAPTQLLLYLSNNFLVHKKNIYIYILFSHQEGDERCMFISHQRNNISFNLLSSESPCSWTLSYTGLCVVPSTSMTWNSSISNFLNNVCRLSPELLFLESVESCRKKICRL